MHFIFTCFPFFYKITDMTRKYCFFLIFILIFSIHVSCSKNKINDTSYNEHEDVSLAKVIVKGTLVVGITNYAPPYYFTNESGLPAGFDVMLFTEIADRLDVEVVFKVLDKENKKRLLESGEIDCVAAYFSYTPDVKNFFPLTTPIIPGAMVVAVMKSDSYKTLNDLSGKNIAIIDSSPVLNEEKNIKYRDSFKSINKYSDFLTGLGDLRLKAVDAAITDLLIISEVMHKQSGVYKILEDAVSSDKYVYAFKSSDRILQQTIEEILIDIEYEGIAEEFSRKWFGADICLFGK